MNTVYFCAHVSLVEINISLANKSCNRHTFINKSLYITLKKAVPMNTIMKLTEKSQFKIFIRYI